jgi:flagella basal body P-ring formation protein FlgA
MTKGVLIFVVALAAGPLSAAEVRLRSSAVCPAPVVRLADIADIRGADQAQNEALGCVALCPAPAAGDNQALSQQQVRQLLVLSGFEPSEIIITGNETVELLTSSAPGAGPAARAPGTVRQAAFSSSRSTAEDAAGDPIVTPRTLAPPRSAAGLKMVQKGAIVTVSARRPGIRVTTSGKALEAGAAGDTIHVELGDSRERILARVVGPQSVEIGTAAPDRDSK